MIIIIVIKYKGDTRLGWMDVSLLFFSLFYDFVFQIKVKQISCSIYDSFIKYVSQKYARHPDNSTQSKHEREV